MINFVPSRMLYKIYYVAIPTCLSNGG
jgi:hypothetical protein